MGTGGARYGAGRPGYKVKTGQLLSLDVRRLARLGYTQRDTSFGWQWSQGDEPTGSIGITAQAGTALTLNYRATIQGQARDYAQRVELAYTACHFGQSRPWALCPRCGHRVAMLYLRAGQFACRHCQRVSYASQSQDVLGRSWIKQRKIEAKLGDKWQRPKGMRQTTHNRLMAELIDCHQRREAALAMFLVRLGAGLSRLNM
jgi:hypothetical protein